MDRSESRKIIGQAGIYRPGSKLQYLAKDKNRRAQLLLAGCIFRETVKTRGSCKQFNSQKKINTNNILCGNEDGNYKKKVSVKMQEIKV